MKINAVLTFLSCASGLCAPHTWYTEMCGVASGRDGMKRHCCVTCICIPVKGTCISYYMHERNSALITLRETYFGEYDRARRLFFGTCSG